MNLAVHVNWLFLDLVVVTLVDGFVEIVVVIVGFVVIAEFVGFVAFGLAAFVVIVVIVEVVEVVVIVAIVEWVAFVGVFAFHLVIHCLVQVYLNRLYPSRLLALKNFFFFLKFF